jgi:hypothetical protein
VKKQLYRGLRAYWQNLDQAIRNNLPDIVTTTRSKKISSEINQVSKPVLVPKATTKASSAHRSKFIQPLRNLLDKQAESDSPRKHLSKWTD